MEDGPAKPDPFPVAQASKLIGVDPKDTALVCRRRSCFLLLQYMYREKRDTTI